MIQLRSLTLLLFIGILFHFSIFPISKARAWAIGLAKITTAATVGAGVGYAIKNRTQKLISSTSAATPAPDEPFLQTSPYEYGQHCSEDRLLGKDSYPFLSDREYSLDDNFPSEPSYSINTEEQEIINALCERLKEFDQIIDFTAKRKKLQTAIAALKEQLETIKTELDQFNNYGTYIRYIFERNKWYAQEALLRSKLYEINAEYMRAKKTLEVEYSMYVEKVIIPFLKSLHQYDKVLLSRVKHKIKNNYAFVETLIKQLTQE